MEIDLEKLFSNAYELYRHRWRLWLGTCLVVAGIGSFSPAIAIAALGLIFIALDKKK